MTCPQDYSELTRLPQGCVNLLDGGGVIWTSSAFSQNEADLKRASKIISGLKLNLSELRADFKSTVEEHSRKVSELNKEALRDIDDINKAHRESSVRTFFCGTAAGVLISAVLVLLI